MHGLRRIPDELGYLDLKEDGAVIASGGELENSESTARVIMALLSSATKKPIWPGDNGDTFKKISVTYPDYSYVITLSNKNIRVVKRKFISQDLE